MSTPTHGDAVHVVDVWAHNQEEELARIHGLARRFPVAASHDGAPAAVSAGQTSGTPDLEGSYEAVRASVERARSAQVGLALASRDGELALGGRIWLFHLGAGDGADGGLADPRSVCAGIRAHSRSAVPRGMLVTSDGAECVAYLVRHINGGGALPRRRVEFLHACGVCFPALYDLRVLAEWANVEGKAPPLAGLCTGTGAGAFRRLLELARDMWFWEMMIRYNAFLYGLGAADNVALVSYKRSKAEREERRRRLKEQLLQIHDEAYVQNILARMI